MQLFTALHQAQTARVSVDQGRTTPPQYAARHSLAPKPNVCVSIGPSSESVHPINCLRPLYIRTRLFGICCVPFCESFSPALGTGAGVLWNSFQIQQLSVQLDQLSREYQNQERNMEQMTIELSTAQAQTADARRETQQLRDQISRRHSLQSDRKPDEDTVQVLREEIKETSAAKRHLEEQLDALQNDLEASRRQLEEKTQTIEMLENTKLKQYQEEIANLQRELQSARYQIENLGGPVEPGTGARGSPLKVEIDSLKREIVKRDDAIIRMEKDCQEKHLRRIDAMQAQLRRFEEETGNLNKVLDEQRAGLEERDRLIRQLRSNQNQTSSVELEKLRAEHARCQEQFDKQTKRINTLSQQIESQSDEILAIKFWHPGSTPDIVLSGCMAAGFQKGAKAERLFEANIALMELTAPKNAASNQALDKMRTERDQLQMQQRQL
ncbi:LOW QUALITY PROTEIN: hypothetical protein T265_13171, partial [Opisthorchis viverrini]